MLTQRSYDRVVLSSASKSLAARLLYCTHGGLEGDVVVLAEGGTEDGASPVVEKSIEAAIGGELRKDILGVLETKVVS